MKGCGAGAVGVALVYLASALISLGDGVGSGIEIPRVLNMIAIMLVLQGGILGGGAWIVDRSAKQSAIRDIQPLLEAEIGRALTAMVPDLACAVAGEVSIIMEPGLRKVVEAVGARNAASFREIVTGDLTEVVNSAVGRAHRAGILQQAQAQGTTGPAKVVSLRMAKDD